MQPKELAYTKDLSDLNTKFWDFDNLLISKFQYFHTQSMESKIQAYVGYPIALLAILSNACFSYETWMIVVLGLNLYL